MNSSPGCGLFMHAPEPRAPPRKVKVEDGSADAEELRVEKKLRVMLEKKIAAISSRLSKETLAKNVAEDRVTALEEEVSGLRECYQRLGDAQDTIHVLKQEVYGKDSAKMEAEQQLKGIDNENRELKHQLAGAEQAVQDRTQRMVELQKEWTTQIDSLVMKETAGKREGRPIFGARNCEERASDAATAGPKTSESV